MRWRKQESNKSSKKSEKEQQNFMRAGNCKSQNNRENKRITKSKKNRRGLLLKLLQKTLKGNKRTLKKRKN